jgi:hypothetical protein
LPFTGSIPQFTENASLAGKNEIIFAHEEQKFKEMTHREHHPQVGIGLFFIILGLALLTATNDWLNLGSIHEYFTWQTALVFIGVILLVNLRFVGGILMIAAGGWFLLDRIYYDVPEFVRTIYWPAVVILIGLSFIISSLAKKRR